MARSIFKNGKYKELEKQVHKALKKYPFKLSASSSPRICGDTIEDAISKEFINIIKKTKIKCSEYKTDYSRRSMADLSFVAENHNYRVDIKTHRNDTKFNMPNLTSVRRLVEFYEDDKNHFVIFFVKYEFKNNIINFEKVSICPIEHFSWDCLTIGALGWGQIQIANSNKIKKTSSSRKAWMIKLCDKLINSFYPKEKNKIDSRIKRFKNVRGFWRKK